MKKTIIYFKFISLCLISCMTFGQNEPIGQIPFTLNDDGLMVISLQINNDTVPNFVLDTGASGTVIDKKIASQLDLPLRDESYQSIGVNAIATNRRTKGQHISLNTKIVLKDLEMSVVDLSHLSKINGLIGFDLFREYVTETNFDTKIISFYQGKDKPNTKGYQTISFVESFCTPEIKVSVSLPNNKSFSGKVFFDTGAVGTPFTFSSPFVDKHDLYSQIETLITSEARGINSTYNISKGTISSIKIKNFNLLEIPISLSSSKQGMLSKDKYMGNLGLEYISKFNFILDYNKKKIYLKPNKSFENAFHFPLSGIGLEVKEDGVFIKSISKPSMANTKGLRVSQQLISINTVEGESKAFYKNLLQQEGEEVTIIVKLENGELKTVKLQLKRLI